MGVYTNLWNNMSMWMTMGILEFHGCLWEFVRVYGGLWEFVRVYGGLWEYMEVYGSFGKKKFITKILITNIYKCDSIFVLLAPLDRNREKDKELFLQ